MGFHPHLRSGRAFGWIGLPLRLADPRANAIGFRRTTDAAALISAVPVNSIGLQSTHPIGYWNFPMDAHLSADDRAFRDEVGAFLRENLPESYPPPDRADPFLCLEGGHADLAQDPLPKGLDRAQLAGGAGRHRLDADAEAHLRRRVPGRRCPAAQPLRSDDGRAGHLYLRHRGAEARASGADPCL